MATCNDCKFWSRNGNTHQGFIDEAPYEVDLPHRKCLRIIHGNGYDMYAQAWVPEYDMTNEPAAVCDGSGYAATLWTKPTFACNSYEPNE